jgi:type I restriction enzyme S subunit
MSREGWKKIKLREACTKIGSGATPRGGKEVYLDNGPYSLIRSQNILDFHFSYNGLAYIDEVQARQLDNVAIEEDDILLNITGDSVARVCQVPSELKKARVNQHVSIIRTDKASLNPQYLKYFLLNPKFKDFLLGCGKNRKRCHFCDKFYLDSTTAYRPATNEISNKTGRGRKSSRSNLQNSCEKLFMKNH